MKVGWELKALGNICFIKNGYSFKSDDFSAKNSIKSIKITNVGVNEFIYDSGSLLPDHFQSQYENFLVKAGSIVIALTRTIISGGLKVALVPNEFNDALLNQRVASISENEKEAIIKFIYLSLSGQQFLNYVNCHVNTLMQPNLSISDLKEFIIPLPSIAEQKRIVTILDKAFENIAIAKANAEQNLKNARELFESYLQSVFTQRGEGWEEKPFSDLCTIKHGFAFKSEYFSTSGDFVLLTPGNFYESGGYRDRGEKQKYYIGDIPQDYVLSKGDLLVAMTEQAAGLLGSPILVPESDRYLHNQRLGLVVNKPNTPWLNEFFFHAFNTKFVRREIHDSATGVKVRHTSPTKIGDVLISYPTSIEEQKSIVNMLKKLGNEIRHLESIYQQKIAALDELKKSLLHKAFSGEL